MQIIVYFLLLASGALALDLCRRKLVNGGIVCVCTKDYCDPLYAPVSKSRDEYLLVTTSKLGDRFAHRYGKIPSGPLVNVVKESLGDNSTHSIIIDSAITYQMMIGFGGGFTGAVAVIVKALPQKLKECIYKSYYSKTFGLGYEYARIPIGSCDFDVEKWAYNEYPPFDYFLSNFSAIDLRDLDRNNELKELTRISKNPNIKLLAAAWSPPPWMKTTFKWTGGPDSRLSPHYYQTWADYHVKYLDVMFKSGTPVWAISTGNEPCSSAGTKFISMYWKNAEHAKWIAENLGPTLARSKYAHVELHGFDDLRISFLEYLDDLENTNKKAIDFIKTWDIHGYSDSQTSAEILTEAHFKYPTKPLFYTEMSYYIDTSEIIPDPEQHLWDRASEQCLNMINNFNNYVTGYIDWNLIVDRGGGPNTEKNYAEAAIVASLDFSEIYKQPLFYSMAQFAKFILPGSLRISMKMKPSDTIQASTFLRPDGKVVVIVQNTSQTNRTNINIIDLKRGNFTVNVKPESINTIVYSAI